MCQELIQNNIFLNRDLHALKNGTIKYMVFESTHYTTQVPNLEN